MGIVTFGPKQDGSGDPSPTNVRPIHPGLTIDGIGDIYGGYVDFENGELVEEWNFKHLIGSDFQSISTGRQGNAPYMPYTYRITDAKALAGSEYKNSMVSDKMRPLTANGGYANIYEGYMNDAWRFLFGAPEDLSTIDVARSWVDEIGGIDIVYQLNTPITYNLTASQLTQVYNQLVPVSPVMINKRRRILLNEPHLATASGSIATFDTDMRSKLNECKINFLPVQSGSGDPSPTNVRPINGWTGLTGRWRRSETGWAA